MNYSVELWNSYNKVENNLLFHLRGLKDFLYLIKEISKSFSSLLFNLKKLQESNLNITTNESLSQGIEYFQQNLLIHCTSLEEFITKINSEIIIPLNTFQENTLKKLNNNYKETLDSEKNYEAYLTQIDFTKDKFHSRVKHLEEKINQKYSSNTQDKNVIKKLDEEIKENIGYAKESEKIYLSYIKYTNRIQEEFIENKKKNLNEIQSMEIDLGKNIKSSLTKYYSFQNNYFKKVLNDTEQKEKLIEQINIIKDINSFIKLNKTTDLPPYPLQYVPYSSQSQNEKVKLEIKNLFPEEKDISSLKTKIDKEIEKFLDSIIEGEKENVISANEKNMKIISNKNYRRIFLRYLNKLRSNTNLTLDEKSFKIIGNLLNECLNYSYKEKDFVCIKLMIVVSTNLFKLNKVSNNPRVFLHEYIKNNLIWKDIKFWENIIKYDINEEMHSQKKYYLYSDENDILYNIRIKDIIKGQVSSNLYNMNLFEVNSSIMFKIINYFSNYYELQSSTIEFLNNIVKNYQINLNEKNEIKISLYNNSKKNSFVEEKNENKEKTGIEAIPKSDEIKNIYKNENINEKKIEKRSKSNNIIYNEGNFGNILIKESKEISGIESDDDIIDESEINYTSNNYT